MLGIADGKLSGDGKTGDVAVTDLDGVVLGCWVADCAPVVLVGAEVTAILGEDDDIPETSNS